MFCYSNNGLSMRAVESSYAPASGEILFPTYATPEELTENFSGYAAAIAAQDAVIAAGNAFGSGLEITSIGTPALDGTYAIDQAAQNNVNATITYILVNGNFPGNSSTMPWYDISNDPHVFPSVAEFKLFATAFANYIAAVSIYASSGGQSGSLPSNQVTIA